MGKNSTVFKSLARIAPFSLSGAKFDPSKYLISKLFCSLILIISRLRDFASSALVMQSLAVLAALQESQIERQT